MAKRKTHNEDCERLLGKPFEHVHAWLDEYVKKYPIRIHLEYHRKFRHHAEGVKHIKKEWGFYAETAAKIHIVRDNELYVLFKPFYEVEIEEIDDLYKKALQYCHKAVEPINVFKDEI